MEETRSTASASARFAVVMLLLVAALIGAGAYSLHERNAVQRLSAQNDQFAASLRDTRTQVDALKAQVTVPAATATAAAPVPIAHPVHKKSAKPTAGIRRDDPRWKKFQAQLDEQGKQIDATRQDLTSTRTELQGSIAQTHDQLVLLEKKGERDYYEFDLDKAKQFSRQGPVGIRLRKANTKHQYADLELMVDDADLSKKHVNLMEPVVFYVAEGGRPVELVIQNISKNHIHGYVSEPKYKSAELTATAAGNATNGMQNPAASSTESAPQPRRRLELSKPPAVKPE